MTTRKSRLVILMAMMLLALSVIQAENEGEVRGTVQRVFQQLKSGDYGSLYDALPAATRTRMSRTRFTGALKRAQDMYVLDRLDIGAVRVSGSIAVVDTVLYGRLVSPIQTEGKIVVQQYLVREEGKWRVATGDRRTIQQFLGANPSFARKFPISTPRIYVKQGNKWIEFNPQKSPRG